MAVTNVNQYGPPRNTQENAYQKVSVCELSGGNPPNRSIKEFAHRMTRMVMIATICDVVLNFPAGSAGSTRPLEAANARRPVIKNSRPMIRITIQAGTYISGSWTKAMKAEEMRNLSASGSRKMPSVVTS